MALVTGESITDAIGAAAEERTKRAESAGLRHDPSVDEILEWVRSFHLEPINEGLSDRRHSGLRAEWILRLMVIDSSALMAILLEEPDASVYAAAILGDMTRLLSSSTLLESSIGAI